MIMEMSLFDQLKDDDDNALSDEAILNVIRSEDEQVLKTGEIADELPITQHWTSQRLNKLESKGRVHSKSAGQGRVWWLDDGEPDYYIAESVGDLMWYASEAEQAATFIWTMSVGMFFVGGLLMIPIFLLGIYPSLRVIPFTTQDFATGAILAAIGGAIFLAGGGILKLASLSLRRRYARKD